LAEREDGRRGTVRNAAFELTGICSGADEVFYPHLAIDNSVHEAHLDLDAIALPAHAAFHHDVCVQQLTDLPRRPARPAGELQRARVRDDSNRADARELARDAIGQPGSQELVRLLGRVLRERKYGNADRWGWPRAGRPEPASHGRHRDQGKYGRSQRESETPSRAPECDVGRRGGCRAGIIECGGPPLEYGNVASARQSDDDRVRSAFARIVLVDLRAKPPRLDADDRIQPRVVGLIAAEDLGADDVFFDLAALAREGPVDDVAQESPHALRIGKSLARQETVELLADLVGAWLHGASMTQNRLSLSLLPFPLSLVPCQSARAAVF